MTPAAERFRAQLLHRPRRSAESVVRHLLAVQAQDARALPLALRARTTSPLRGDFVITWLFRGTLHLVLREDVGWLHALCAPRMEAGSRRRLRQLEISEATADRAVKLIASAIEDDGPLDREALGERLAARDIPVAGQRLPHLLGRAAMAALVVLDLDRRFVRADPPAPPDRETSLRELGRRYLAAHPGADARDLAHWSGLPLSDARLPDPPRTRSGAAPLRLIPAFDELLLGWRDRAPTVPPALARRVHPGGGILRAVVLEDGVAVGTWGLRAGRVSIEAEVHDTTALAREVAEIES
jgi:hypothetical protein